MFAIEITTENMPKIQECEALQKHNEDTLNAYLANYEKRGKRWYAIRGYVTRQGRVQDFAILPAYVFENEFEYDPDKIKTDWDQIVRK